MKKCLSQICICGRHRCPHNYVRNIIVPVPEVGALKPSETSESFHAYPYQAPRPAIKPPVIAWTDDKPMQSQSTTRTDYIAYEIGPRKPVEKIKYKPPAGRMFSDSTYKEDFCKGDRVQPVRESCRPQLGYVPPTQAMERTTMTAVSFVPWGAEEMKNARGQTVKQTGCLSTPKAHMEGATVTMKDFRAPNTPKRELGKCRPDNLHVEGPFSGDSIYRTEFVPKVPVPAERMLPRRRRLELPAFKGQSTYAHDFTPPVPIIQHASFRPDAKYKEPEHGFEDRTRYRVDYPAWPIPPKEVHPWAQAGIYKKPTIAMEDKSSYKENFCNPPETKMPERGKGQAGSFTIGEQATMQSETSHKVDYVYYPDVKKAESFAENRLYKPPTQKFANQSITRSHYKGQFGPPARPITTTPNLAPETGKMSNLTSHKIDFQPQTHVCPITLIQSHAPDTCPGLKFVGNIKGHEFYETDNS